MKPSPSLLAACLAALGLLSAPLLAAERSLVFEARPGGPGQGKHVVLIAGDEEYRSEEALPMLAKILSQRHGFKCTVLFSTDEDGTINPDAGKSLSDAEPINSADLLLLSLRFRNWPEEALATFEKAYLAGKPVVGLRTSTHAFNGNRLADFGKRVLGEKWVSHWGRHKSEATLAISEPEAEGSPLLHGVSNVFGTTDVYEAYPPADATILLRGRVLAGMTPDSAPAAYAKKRSTDKVEQDVNTPMMPVAWTRLHTNESGKTNRVFCTTMGAANEFENEGLRRLVVNGVYWGLGLDVPAKAPVDFVDEYKPGFYGFKGYRKGMKISDLGLGKAMPGEPSPAPTPKP
jgi:type 1 glutamine amidotransferase